MRIARANASWPSVVSRPVRCGSSEVWIAWKSCSGARAISSTSKTIPASALFAGGRRDRQHGGVQQRLLGEHDPRDPAGEARAAAQRELVFVGGRLLHALGARPGERRVDLIGRDRPGEGRVGVVDGMLARRPSASALLRASPRERGRHDAPARRAARPRSQRERRLAAGDADRHGEREAQPRERLHQHEPAVQREVLVAGQPAAREVAGGVGERADDEHPVERFVVVEDVVDAAVR